MSLSNDCVLSSGNRKAFGVLSAKGVNFMRILYVVIYSFEYLELKAIIDHKQCDLETSLILSVQRIVGALKYTQFESKNRMKHYIIYLGIELYIQNIWIEEMLDS